MEAYRTLPDYDTHVVVDARLITHITQLVGRGCSRAASGYWTSGIPCFEESCNSRALCVVAAEIDVMLCLNDIF